jgi:EAL domain-containing protein (putative c-di-GMP-specific phosphodiesterase class I)
VAELIQFAHVLKLIVVAEGVEQEAQAAFLRSAGCERIQGFLFAPALPASQCEPLLRRSGTDLRQAG